MKLNQLIVSILAVLALTACSKENEGTGSGSSDSPGLSVTVALRSSGTRSVVSGSENFTTQTAITLEDVTVYFANGSNGNIVDTKSFSPEEIEAGSAVFHNINPSASHAVVVANASSLLTPAPTSISTLEAVNLKLSDLQDLSAVPLLSNVGELEANDASHTAPADGSETDVEVDYRKVDLTVVPVLSRIEIGGTLTLTATDGAADGKFVYSKFTPAYVGLNGLHDVCTLAGTGVGEAVWATDNQRGFPVVGTTPSWMYDAFEEVDAVDLIGAPDHSSTMSNVYAYNVMPGEEPVILLHFASDPLPAAEIPEGIAAASPAYLKIVNFTDAATAQPLTIEAGKIYTIRDLTFDQTDLTWLDNTVLCVEVSVTVEDWQIEDVTPEFGE